MVGRYLSFKNNYVVGVSNDLGASARETITEYTAHRRVKCVGVGALFRQPRRIRTYAIGVGGIHGRSGLPVGARGTRMDTCGWYIVDTRFIDDDIVIRDDNAMTY